MTADASGAPSGSPGAPRPATLAACACAIALGVALAHGGAIGHGFVAFDDDALVYRNPAVAGGLNWASVRRAFAFDQPQGYFHPLTRVSFLLDAELFGMDPLGFHLVNLLLHAAASVLLFLFLARTTGGLAGALLAALLFGVHPMTVEAVAWVSERKAVLSSALGMLALHAWTARVRRPSPVRYALTAGAFLLALLAKPGIVTLPLVLLALDAWPLGRAVDGPAPGGARTWRSLVLEKLPLTAIAGIVTVVTLVSTARIEAREGLAAPFPLRVTNALASIGSYLGSAFWPSGLGPLHAFPEQHPVGAALVGGMLLAGLSVAAFRLRRRAPWLLAGWGWFLAALLPYLGFVQAGLWPSWAERFAYFALPGLAVAAGYTVAAWAATPRRIAAAATALLVPLVVAARIQVGHWSDTLRLFERGVEVEPESCAMNFGLGRALLDASRTTEAERPLRLAATRCPTVAAAHQELGLALLALGRREEAEEEFALARAAEELAR